MFTALNRFIVSERPMASERTDSFKHTPPSRWLANEKVKRALEGLTRRSDPKYVEDGDTLYKVRRKR